MSTTKIMLVDGIRFVNSEPRRSIICQQELFMRQTDGSYMLSYKNAGILIQALVGFGLLKPTINISGE